MKFSKSYSIYAPFPVGEVHSKVWNSTMIVRANGRAYSLIAFVADFGVSGLERLLHYVDMAKKDNIKVRIKGVTVYVHFK